MCGRFALYSPARTLKNIFRLDIILPDALKPSWNIAPTHEVAAVIQDQERRLEMLRWGLVPSWAADLSGAARLINARSESLPQKPAFRDAFKKRRCLIPADGFYEWQRTGRSRQPFYITSPDKIPFAFAGLWEIWKDRRNGESCFSCTIITTEADLSLQPLHSRMPVILNSGFYDAWLDPSKRNPERILSQGRVHDPVFYPVSSRVNSANHNDPACIAASGSREIQLKL